MEDLTAKCSTIFLSEKTLAFKYKYFSLQLFVTYLLSRFSPGNCSSNNMMTNCLNSHHFGVKCVWDNEKGICLPFSDMPPDAPSIDFESTYRYCQLKKLSYMCKNYEY